ncbi:MAG: F0F1 ATP synthase subunit epsilon [Acidobacteriota bacterium]
MLPKRIRLELVTPERRVLREEVQEVVLPGSEGYFGVLPGHAPLLSMVEIGEVMYRKGTEKHYIAISGGFVEVLSETVSVLVETAEKAEEIDLERARSSLRRAEERFRKPPADLDFQRSRGSLQKALIRIQISGRQVP